MTPLPTAVATPAAPGAGPSGSALAPEAREAFAYLRTLVRDRAAIALDEGKEYLAEARLGSIARARGHSSVWALLLHLRSASNSSLHTEVVEAMTTNETSFFRDPTLFDGIRDVVIPDLVSSRSADRRISVWSAACSTGQEPYSLAMLLREHPALPASWTTKILATDLNTAVLERARGGRFTRLEANRGLAAARLVRWFTQAGTDWQIAQELRSMIDFRQLNLVGPWPLVPPVDLVLLRNVLIYFPVDVKRRVLAQVRSVLRPGGYLILGNAETTLNLDDKFERVAIGSASAYRTIGSKEGAP